MLGGAADRDGVNAVCVAITVTIISLTTSIPRGPNKDGALPLSPLKEKTKYKSNDHHLLWLLTRPQNYQKIHVECSQRQFFEICLEFQGLEGQRQAVY